MYFGGNSATYLAMAAGSGRSQHLVNEHNIRVGECNSRQNDIPPWCEADQRNSISPSARLHSEIMNAQLNETRLSLPDDVVEIVWNKIQDVGGVRRGREC